MYVTGSVTSLDGTTIGYRRLGSGPAVVAVHGGGQAAQNLMSLAGALADGFTVYLPDRRGRGLSGPVGDRYGLTAECEDVAALLEVSGAHCLFGLSSGALICLQAALTVPGVLKVALYEPPLSIDHSTPTGWVIRYEQELARGQLGAAMLTAARGTQTAPLVLKVLPRSLLAPLLDIAARRGTADRSEPLLGRRLADRPVLRSTLRVLLWPLRRLDRGAAVGDGSTGGGDDVVPLAELVTTLRHDAALVIGSEGTLGTFREVPADVLLLGGSRSPTYLKNTLSALATVLPRARLVVLQGVGHLAPDNSGAPGVVAERLRAFFAPP